MSDIITQTDEQCVQCGCELPRGSWAKTDEYEELYCEDCWEDHKTEVSNNLMGDEYGI